MTPLDIFINGRFYGTLRIRHLGNIVAISNDELKSEIERRLPYLKNKNYRIEF